MHNGVKWFEIPATDFDRAVRFYAELLDVELTACASGDEEMAFFPEAERNVGGSISRARDFAPSPHGVLVYFDATGRMDALLRKVEAGGGEVLVPPTAIEAEGRGTFALFKDPEGNRIGLHAD
jgi:predicted enzyme related to lactoylglutathione lyase